jgi:Smr domain
MTRPLSAEERALWRRVVADVQPSGTIRPSVPGTLPKNRIMVRQQSVAPVHPGAVGTTLDHKWDRKLRLGEVEPDRVIDLHGLTLDAAHSRVIRALTDAVRDDARILVLVTGKPPPKGTSRLDTPLRGIIRASIYDWISASPCAGHVAAIRGANRRHGGDGAIYVVLRRKKRPAT